MFSMKRLTYRRHTSSCTSYKFIRIFDVLVGWYQRTHVLNSRVPETNQWREKNGEIAQNAIYINQITKKNKKLRWEISAAT